MFYQALIALSFAVLAVVGLRAYRMNTSGTRYSVISLYLCALTFVLSGMHPQTVNPTPLWLTCLTTLAFALLFPLLFINLKHYTTLSLPQWRALRAFSLGIPVLVGLDGAVAGIGQPSAVPQAMFPSYVWTAYCFALFCVLVTTWRFTTTPRQRGPILLLLAVPVVIVGADLSFRLEGWLLLERNPAVVATLACILVLTILLMRHDHFSVRPVARSALIDQVHDILLVIDPNQRIVDCNRAAAQWFNTTERSLIGSEARAWLPEDVYDQISADAVQHIVVPWDKQDTAYWFEVVSNELVIDRQIHGTLVTFRDVSERRRIELALMESRRQLEAANAKLRELANTDALTGLYNRRALMERLSAEIERHSRSGLTLGLLMLDLDHFKRINDRYGHPIGDIVLQQAAQCMRQTVRESDVVARIGGEEFAIIAVDTRDEGPFVLAGRLKEQLAAVSITTDDGQTVSFTASIGCVHFTGGVVDADTLLTLADQALYTSKRGGRDRVTNRVFDRSGTAISA